MAGGMQSKKKKGRKRRKDCTTGMYMLRKE
jgi:hypothetical protein